MEATVRQRVPAKVLFCAHGYIEEREVRVRA